MNWERVFAVMGKIYGFGPAEVAGMTLGQLRGYLAQAAETG